MCYLGATRKYYTSGTPGPLADWISGDDVSMHKKSFFKEQGGYGPPLNWYKCQMANLNTPDEAQVPKDHYYLKVSTLLITCKNDPIGVPVVQVEGMKPWIKKDLLTVVEVDSGHWCQLEKAQEVNEVLEQFL